MRYPMGMLDRQYFDLFFSASDLHLHATIGMHIFDAKSVHRACATMPANGAVSRRLRVHSRMHGTVTR